MDFVVTRFQPDAGVAYQFVFVLIVLLSGEVIVLITFGFVLLFRVGIHFFIRRKLSFNEVVREPQASQFVPGEQLQECFLFRSRKLMSICSPGFPSIMGISLSSGRVSCSGGFRQRLKAYRFGKFSSFTTSVMAASDGEVVAGNQFFNPR